uniref:Uncharacterized protein n=1 Tax=Rhizophora mucronata TaxID=61149 RepID=A0A2P2NY98_RHIMU
MEFYPFLFFFSFSFDPVGSFHRKGIFCKPSFNYPGIFNFLEGLQNLRIALNSYYTL